MIRLCQIDVVYRVGEQEIRALDRLSLHLDGGEFVAIVGTSGSGKSTLLNVLGCLRTPTSGQYWLGDENVGALDELTLARVRNREIGFIFQSFQLLPEMTAVENVMLPLVYRGTNRRRRREAAERALRVVGLDTRKLHRPAQMSGGQKQRVAIARALVAKPSVILADEPTGSLDSSSTVEVLRLLTEIHRAGNTVIVVTHDPDVAVAAERQIRIHDGRVVDDRMNPRCRTQ